VALFLCGLMLPAAAASFDCAKAANPLAKAICTDPGLSAADDKLVGRYAEAMARTLDPGKLHDEQRQWSARLEKGKATAAAIADAYQNRLNQLDREIAWLDQIEPARDTTEDAARAGCPALFDDPADTAGPCKVANFGAVGTVDGRTFFYGLYIYTIPAGDDPVHTAVVIFERRADGRLRALYAPQEAAGFFSQPQIIAEAGHTLLQLPGYDSGTGDFNVERLFLWKNAVWNYFDTDEWHSGLAHRLPRGYEIWKGVFPDYRKMTGTTPLWLVKTDGNCCPTGGRADFTLGWQGDRLVVKSVQVKLGVRYAN
jgi:uncharacterized protein